MRKNARKTDARHNKLWREIARKHKMWTTVWKLWRTCRIVPHEPRRLPLFIKRITIRRHISCNIQKNIV